MADQTPDTAPETPRPVSLRGEAPEPAPAPPVSNNSFLVFGVIVMVLLIVVALIFVVGSRDDSLSEAEVQRIVEEVVRTQVARLLAASGASGGGVDSAAVQQMVDEAVGTEVALLRPTHTPVPPTPTVIPRGVAEQDDAYLGPEDAPVVIVEFSDFQCSFCGRWFNETLPKLLDAYPNEVKFVYRDFPIFGEDSRRAAMATECAEEQDMFWEMHNRLFERLLNREEADLSEASLVNFADDLGMDTRSFAECLSSQRYYDEILEDFRAAEAYGLRGTPGFVINGVVYAIGAQPYEVFSQIVQEELARVQN